MAELAENSKSRVIISNHDTAFTRELYKNADKIIELSVTRSISAKADSRKKSQGITCNLQGGLHHD